MLKNKVSGNAHYGDIFRFELSLPSTTELLHVVETEGTNRSELV